MLADLFNLYDCYFIALTTQCQHAELFSKRLLADPVDVFSVWWQNACKSIQATRDHDPAVIRALEWTTWWHGVFPVVDELVSSADISEISHPAMSRNLTEVAIGYIHFLRGNLWLICLKVKRLSFLLQVSLWFSLFQCIEMSKMASVAK